MTTTGYRIVYAILGVLFAAVVMGSVFLIPSGEENALPPAVESFSPGDGDIAIRQVQVVIDLLPDYEAQFVIDGITIPESEVNAIPRPGGTSSNPARARSSRNGRPVTTRWW